MKVFSQYNSNFSKCINDSFYWYRKVLFQKYKEKVKEFLLNDFNLKIVGISEQDNIFFSGEEYFVTRIRVDSVNEVFFRISAPLINIILSNSLGKMNFEFTTEAITELEARILTELNNYIYKGIAPFLVKDKMPEGNPTLAHFTFAAEDSLGNRGKFVLSVPVNMLPEVRPVTTYQNFDLDSFPKYKASVKIITGKSQLTLYDLRHLESGDIVVLEQSNIKIMTIELLGEKQPFVINPDTSLITGVNNDGDDSMDANSMNNGIQSSMWDSIPVEITAEFEKVTINLGELKQISEGVIVDLANIYENKITLKVENKSIATGELLIINDKYAVRVDEVFSDNPQAQIPQVQENTASVPQEVTQENVPQAQAPDQQGENQNSDDFNYDNFDIEDEDI